MFDYLKKFEKIVVTGPQRSGTRIAAHMIAFDLGYEVVDEVVFGAHSEENFRTILKHWTNAVIHAPAMSHIVHTLCENIAIVFMKREREDIIKSEQRIGWASFENDREIGKYCKLKEFYDNSFKKSCDVKQAVWDNFQKRMIKHRFEIAFSSLKGHALFKSRDERTDFRWNQTK